MADDIDIADARAEFERCNSSESHNRETAREDLEFARGGNHWPENIRSQRLAEGRPVLTISKLPAYLRQVVNDARLNSPTIKVSPVDDEADVETAAVIGDLIRNIEYASDADVAYDTGAECAASNGFGYWRITADHVRADSFDMGLRIGRIRNPFSVYGDPDSQAADSADWDVAFVTNRVNEKQWQRKWGKKATVSWDDADAWGGADWRDTEGAIVAEWWTRDVVPTKILLIGPPRAGAPEHAQPFVIKADAFEKDEDMQAMLQAGLIEVWRERETEMPRVMQRFMSGAEILETRDWPGRYIPIIPVYGDEFDIEGKVYRRSLVHDALDAQRRYDYWSTNLTELVALAPRVPFIGPKGTFKTDAARWATANTQSHSYLEYDVVPGAAGGPQRQPLDMGTAAGSLQQALMANDDIKAIIGLHDASMGARSNETSGKAILARQREGDVSTFHFHDNQARAIRHTGRVLVDLIPHFYNTERIIRVRGEDGSERKVQINKPFPKLDEQTGQPVQEPQKDERGNPMVGDDGQPLMQTVMAMHDLSLGTYDVTVSAGPSFTTRRQEAAEQMMEMIRVYPAVAPLVGDLIAKKLDWPGADEIAERLKRMSGADTWISQVVPAQDYGDATNTTPLTDGNAQEVTYATAKDSWKQTLATDGWATNKTLKRGQVFNIDGVYMVNPRTKQSTGILQDFVVLVDTPTNANAANNTDFDISPPIITSGPHQTVTYAGNFDGRAITLKGPLATATYRQNVLFSKGAFALACVPMEMPQAVGDRGARETYKGLSIRLVPVYDGINDVEKWRLDILYGRKTIDPRKAVRFSGS